MKKCLYLCTVKQKQLTIKTITIMKTYFIIERKQSKNFKGMQLNFKEYAMTRNSFTNLLHGAKRFASQDAAENYAKKWFNGLAGEFIVLRYVIY